MRTKFRNYIRDSLVVDILPVRSIVTSQFSLREDIGDVRELAASIKSKGLLEPIIVRPLGSKFEVVVGHRRLQAHKINRSTEIRAIVQDLTDKAAFEISLEENIHRKSLDPMEEAKAFKFYARKYGYGSISELARRIGKSQEYVSHRIILLELPNSVQEMLRKHLISVSSGWEISRIKDSVKTEVVANAVLANRPTIEVLRKTVNEMKTGSLIEESWQLGLPEFRTDRRGSRMLKIRSNAKTILRATLVKIDDVIDHMEDTDEEERALKEELLSIRYAIHGVIDQFAGDKLSKSNVEREITSFIERVFLNSYNSGNISAYSKYRCDSFTVFDDFPPYGLLRNDEFKKNESRIWGLARESECAISNLRITPFCGGAVATFVFKYNVDINKNHCDWTSRVTIVLSRNIKNWEVIHEQWSPCEFYHKPSAILNDIVP
jgi:ParB family chromosome partitioning protein